MESMSEKHITYFILLKIGFRLYGLYILVSGLLESLMYVANFPGTEDLSRMLYLMKLDELFMGISSLLIGLCLLFFTNQLTRKIVEPEREVSLKYEEAKYLLYYVLQFVLTVLLLDNAIFFLATIAIILYKADQAFRFNDLIALIPPVFFLFVIYLIRRNAMRIAQLLVK